MIFFVDDETDEEASDVIADATFAEGRVLPFCSKANAGGFTIAPKVEIPVLMNAARGYS